MKYAKKMKLVSIDEPHHITKEYNLQLPDEYFTNPNVLFNLDGQMTHILSRQDLPDSEKWTMYSQVLQKYLRHQNKATKPSSIVATNPGNSLQTITQPSVREFFESAREIAPHETLFEQPEAIHKTPIKESNNINQLIRMRKKRKNDLNDNITLHCRREGRKKAIINAVSSPTSSNTNKHSIFYKWKPYTPKH